MPPPKKAAKKSAKKAGKQDPEVRGANHLRRAFEHMGRLEVLQATLKASAAEAITALANLAQQEVQRGKNKDAADLLRASEHLSFAALAGDGSAGGRLTAELKHSIAEHFAELTRRADELWEEKEQHASLLAAIYRSARKSAAEAFKSRAYHRALELARAAEVLAHIKEHEPHNLATGKKNLKLKAA